MGEELGEAVGARLTLEVRRHDLDVAAVLPKELAARPAGGRGLGRLRHDGERLEVAPARRERREERDALGADSQAVRRVLDVATLDDLAVARAERGADAIVRVRRDGTPARLARGLDQPLPVAHRAGRYTGQRTTGNRF